MIDVLFYTDHFKGLIIPTFALAQNLQKSGYKVSYMGIAKAMTEAKKAGFDTISVFEDHYSEDNAEYVQGKNKSPLHLILEGSLDEVVNELNPKIVFLNSENGLEALAFYYKYKIKMALFWPYFPEKDYLDPNLSPYADFMQDKIMDGIYNYPDPNALTLLLDFLEETGQGIKNLTDIGKPVEHFNHVVACSKKFLKTKTLHRRNEIYLGTCTFDDKEPEFSLEDFYTTLGLNKVDNQQFIYCTMGSWANEYSYTMALQVFKKIIACMAHESMKEYKLIIAAAKLSDSLTNEVIPPNVHIYDWLPQTKILKFMSLFVTHGGLGSVKDSIYYEIPMVVNPLAIDQFPNAKRIDHHRIGIELDILSKTTEEIIELLITTLNDETIKANLTKMNNAFEQDSRIANRLIAKIMREQKPVVSLS